MAKERTLPCEIEKLQENALGIAMETGIWLFSRLTPTILPMYQKFEFVVGDATLDLTNDEILHVFQMLLR